MKTLCYVLCSILPMFAKILMTNMQPLNNGDIQFCNKNKTFTGEQKEFCYQNAKLVKVIQKGYQLGYQMCQRAFEGANSGTRWNCTNIVDRQRRNMFLGVPHAREGSKEHAIMMTFTAAGMLYHLIKRCQNDELTSCKPKDLYNCQNLDKACRQQIDMNVPLRLIRTFFLVSSPGNYQVQLNQHNREIGLQAVRKSMHTKTGTSNDEKLILAKIEKRLHHVYVNRAEKLKKKHLLKGKIPILLLPLRSKLVFLLRNDRFSYCHRNENWYWNGIGRRPCKVETRDSFSLENCVNLCCDYGYVNIPQVKTICSHSKPKKCRLETVNKYYCKYRSETVKKKYDIPYADFV